MENLIMGAHVRITFYVGLARSTDRGRPNYATVEARAGAVARYFARAYPSGTFKRAEGFWQEVAEPSATFEVIMPDEPTTRPNAYDVAARLTVLHKQEGVGVAIDPVIFRIMGPDDLPSVFHGRYAKQGSTLESLDTPPAWGATDELRANAGRVAGAGLLGDLGTFLESGRDRDAEARKAAGRG